MAAPDDNVWAIVPVKPFAEAKSRTRLPAGDRLQLSGMLFDHVAGVLGDVLPPHRIVVVSKDENALAMARAAGRRALREVAPHSLNDALAQAMAWVRQRGASAVLSIATDLPDLVAEDVEAMIRARGRNRLVIAPDEAGTGTNALLVAPHSVPYLYGSGSFWRHIQAASDVGMGIEIISRPGLMRDVDTPAQVARLIADWTAADRPTGQTIR